MTSDPTLRRLYLRYNKLFFNGELPLEVAIYWAPLGDAVGMSEDAPASLKKEGASYLIRIDPVLGGLPRFIRQTVVHEMAHIKLFKQNISDHGKEWDKEIQRLTKFRAYRKML